MPDRIYRLSVAAGCEPPLRPYQQIQAAAIRLPLLTAGAQRRNDGIGSGADTVIEFPSGNRSVPPRNAPAARTETGVVSFQ